MIQVYDHFLSKKDEDFIENHVTSGYFPWYLKNETVRPDNRFVSDTRFVDFPWLSHETHINGKENSSCLEIPNRIIEVLNGKFNNIYKEIRQSRLNLVFKSNDDRKSPPHYDFYDDNIDTMIYYVNDSDGNTIFYADEKANTILQEVEPKKGRIVIFSSKTLHAATRPKENHTRIVINFNMVK
jgi:hypothetical protein